MTKRRRCCCGARAHGPAGPRTAGQQGAGAAGRGAPGRWAKLGAGATRRRRGAGCKDAAGGVGRGAARRASRYRVRLTETAPAVVMEILQPSGSRAVASLENNPSQADP